MSGFAADLFLNPKVGALEGITVQCEIWKVKCVMRGKTEPQFLIKSRKHAKRLWNFLKYLVVSGVIGIVVGLVGTAFFYGMEAVQTIRQAYPMVVLGLPLAGLLIVFLYHLARREEDHGTNSVLAAVRSEEQLSVVTAPLIFISTLLSHLCGGSVGREGAALQMGGSLGSGLGRLFRLKDTDMRAAVMCGMSACFSVLFGTPMAAAFFSMEVVNVGVMQYSALVPCVFAGLFALYTGRYLGVEGEALTIAVVPEFTAVNVGKMVLVAVLCSAVSILFCILMHEVAKIGKRWIANPYVRIFAAGVLIVVLNFLLGTTDYMGAGMPVVEHALHGEVRPEAFVLKMLLTALALGTGYKGGEIVPSFFVGATFGCLMGQLVGVSPSMCAAVGMIAVFCGVTNSPITSLLIALELFGREGIYFVLIGIAVSYMLSGYYSLYDSQKIMLSKYEPEYRNKWKQ